MTQKFFMNEKMGTVSHSQPQFFLPTHDCRSNLSAMQQLNGPAARDKIDDGDDQSNHQKQMNQPAGHVESPAQKPQDDEDGKNCPEHKYPLNQIRALTVIKVKRQLLRPELSF